MSTPPPTDEPGAAGRLRRKPGVMDSVFGDERVLFDLDGEAYYAFDDITARVWELLEPGATLDELVAALVAEYEVSPEVCRADLRELVGRLRARGLVVADGEG